MDRADADLFLSNYGELLKRWTMAVTGISLGNIEAMAFALRQGHSALLQIAEKYPDKAYSVDLLISALTRGSPDDEARNWRPGETLH